jgi:AhpD family alkylhydroperoxidase
MENSMKSFFEKFGKDAAKMKELMPEATSGFMSLFANVMQDGALTTKQKELIALGIGVAVHCKECIRMHTQKCVATGASKEEILEAAAVSIMMAGGPAYTHIPEVLDTLDALGK